MDTVSTVTDALGITGGVTAIGERIGVLDPPPAAVPKGKSTPRARERSLQEIPRKQVHGAGGSGGGGGAAHGEDRDLFDVPGVTDQALLETIAERIWEERSRQELEGHAVTYEMSVPAFGSDRMIGAAHLTVPEVDTTGDEIDLLTLGAGDVIRIEFDPEHMKEIGQLSNLEDRIDRMTSLGYSEQVAELVARNLSDFAKLNATFFVREVQITLETTEDAGSFEVAITYCNRIQVDGSADKVAT